jgi:hypothetical protein
VRAPKVTASDLEAVLIGTRELTRMGSARTPLGVPDDQLGGTAGGSTTGATGVTGTAGATTSPAAAPSPSPGAPAPGSLSPPVPPPGAPALIPPASGVGPPAGVAPPVLPAPSPSPSPLAGASVGAAGGDASATMAMGGVSAVFSPADVRIPVGGSGSIGVVVMGAQDLRGVDLTVTYDPALVEAQDVSPGPLLTLDGSPVGVNRGLESGRLRAQFTRAAGSAGSGVVATLTFRGLRAGVATIAVEALSLTTGTASALVAVPAPSRITVGQ